LLKPYDQWITDDWTAHFEDVLSRPGVARGVSGRIHRTLGQLYHTAKPRLALDHYRAAAAVGFAAAADYREVGDYLFDLSQRDESLTPDCAQLLAELAWRLATSPVAAMRNGELSVGLASRANQLCGDRPETLLALSAAYAEAGQFSEARGTARQAFDLADQQDKAELADEIRSAIRLFELNRPVRRVPLAPGIW
jgi:hypothetical protein